MSDLSVFFWEPTENRNTSVTLDETITAAEAIAELIFAGFIAPQDPDNVVLEILGKDRNLENNESFKAARVQSGNIILVKTSSDMAGAGLKKVLELSPQATTAKADIKVIIEHPTDGRVIQVTLDGTMTEAEAIKELIFNDFIPSSILGYKLGKKGGRLFRDKETFIDIGTTPGCQIVIKPNYSIKVFISYAKEDFEIAVKIYEKLRKDINIIPWLDTESLLPGKRWKIEIKHAIRDCDFFIALLSKNSVNKRGFVQKEIKDALEILDEIPESKIFFIPVRLDECRLTHPTFQELHWVDLFPSFHEGIIKIIYTIISEYTTEEK